MRFEHYHFGASALQISHVMICESAVKRKSLGQLALNVLKLFPSYAERVQVTGDLIGRPHPLENYAARLTSVASAPLRNDGSRLAERLSNAQQGQKHTRDYENGSI